MQKKLKKRLLIFIVAQNAEEKIESVLNRIPTDALEIYDYEILIIDDSSKDKTFEKAHDFQNLNQDIKLKILFNPSSQGYGGNQKLGYEYAIQNDYDTIVVLHGDGQYPPEMLGKIISPIFNKEADAVFGSRMLVKGDARKGGMPIYRYYGNKLLTWFQNRLLGTRLTEFHSGYRAYSVKTLKEIPYKRNSNDFHFDTQITIQLFLARKRIKEIPIPTYYGKEIYRVNAINYGWNVLKASIGVHLHNLSIFYKREFDVTPPSEEYPLKLGYMSSHTLAINNTNNHSKVLDIGGGQGRIARELKKKSCFVAGIDRCRLENPDVYDQFYQEDLDFTSFDFDLSEFDTILMLDIIEHLANPEEFLDKLRERARLNQPKIIVTSPNIAFFILRFQLLFGQFNYGKQGILDKTHKRLFNFRTMKTIFRQCGYTVEKVRGIPAPFPKAVGINWLGRSMIAINRFFIFFSKSLFSYQIYMEVKPTPIVEVLLEFSLSESKKREENLCPKNSGNNQVWE
jgi:glycosyltransferase involved in cell wall biosynthesis